MDIQSFRINFFYLVFIFITTLIWNPTFAAGIDCKVLYEVKRNDTLSGIASSAYDNAGKYNIIYYANSNVLNKGPSVIQVGQKLRIPCPENKNTAQEPQTVTEQKSTVAPDTAKPAQTAPSPTIQKIELLTAGDYPPFTEQSLPGGGLITELITTALDQNNAPYTLNWIDDWSAHLNPLLSERKYDVGFPWFDPGCPRSESFRCNFLFSKSVFDLLIVLFTRTDQPLKFENDEDIPGSTLCRPDGYFTHDLDNNGRNWLKDKKITLKQPKAVKDCFDLLMDGKVDAVAINDFTGREQVSEMGLTDKVIPLERELSIEGMHALVHKSHPRATILINRINRGFADLHSSGKYDEIMDQHLMNHWKNIESSE